MDDRPYPDVRRGVMAGCIAGSIGGVVGFLASVQIAHDDAFVFGFDWPLRPWWWMRNWKFAGGAFLFFFLAVGILAALRPRTEAGRQRSFLTGRRRVE